MRGKKTFQMSNDNALGRPAANYIESIMHDD